MIETATGVDILKRLPPERPIPMDGDDLADLICLLLAEEARSVIRRGVIRDYREVEDSVGVLRGRLRHRDQMARRYNQVQTLECRFDEYDADVADSQLLAAGLSAARLVAKAPDIARTCAQLAKVLLAVCSPETSDPGWYGRVIRYTRRNQHYRAGHKLASLILGGHGVSDLFLLRGQGVGTFLLDMNRIFEVFIQRLATEAQLSSDYSVTSQQRLRAVIRDDLRGKPYSQIIPDLVVEAVRDGTRVPIDVKYKRYDQRNISSVTSTRRSCMPSRSLAPGALPRAGIFSPAKSTIKAPQLSIHGTSSPTRAAARIVGVGIDVLNLLEGLLGADWPSLLAQLRADVEFVVAGARRTA